MNPKTKLLLLGVLGVAFLCGVVLIAVAQFARPRRRRWLHAVGVGMTGTSLGSLIVIAFS